MALKDLVFGLFDTSRGIGDGDLAARARSWTLGWSRFKYFGPILEDASLGRLLDRVLERGFRYCFVQPYGHLVAESWNPDHRGGTDFLADLAALAASGGFLVAGSPPGNGRPGAFLVDAERWDLLGRPSDLRRASEEAGLPVPAFPAPVESCLVSLAPDVPPRAAALRRLLEEGFGISTDGVWDPAAESFLRRLGTQIENARRGLFVWNFEPYDDVEEPPPGFQPPLAAVYGVGAGLKVNRILHTHGFDAETRVVIFDYSPAALEFRRRLREEWDGTGYPAFLRRLFQALPPDRAFYWLWGDATPETLDWAEVERHWQRELEIWGGEEVLREHWERYRELRHEYVHCDVLAHPEPLWESLDGRPSSVIWWSNAFCTVYSNWLYTVEERRRLYERWIDALADRAPDLHLYGSDAANASINHIRAAEYRDLYRRGTGDPDLEPRKVHRREIRF